jgi:hypothetical protein
MNKLSQKKKWETPKLIILLRRKLEEAVLAPCKELCTDVISSTILGPGCVTKHSHKFGGFS